MFSLEELLVGVQAEATRQTPILPSQLQQVMFTDSAIDSREVTANSLFVALPGARVDGHSFVADAVANGARGALVNREKIEGMTLERPWVRVEPDGQGLEQVTPETVLLIAVENPLDSFHRLAAYHRGLFAPTVIGITGSVGKTSTKEVTAAVLKRRYRTLKNPRSYNNESTLPIVLLQLTGNHEVAVLEMGCYGPGD
ncbi:MAG: Mur ligase family protein, partial [Chloroflexota bacterium]